MYSKQNLKKHKFSDNIEVLFIEINFRKWLLCDIYRPLAQSDQHFFDNLDPLTRKFWKMGILIPKKEKNKHFVSTWIEIS